MTVSDGIIQDTKNTLVEKSVPDQVFDKDTQDQSSSHILQTCDNCLSETTSIRRKQTVPSESHKVADNCKEKAKVAPVSMIFKNLHEWTTLGTARYLTSCQQPIEQGLQDMHISISKLEREHSRNSPQIDDEFKKADLNKAYEKKVFSTC
jgi:hypothetical protein